MLAASVAHAMPGGTYPKIVDLALKKLAFDLPELPDTPTEFPRPARNAPTVLVHFPEQARRRAPRPELGEIYATLEAATRLRKRVTLTYQAADERHDVASATLDPYAMVYREGAWLVVGWCHLRKEIRSFRVDRIREAVMAPKPKSPDFERPGRLRRQGVRDALAVDVHRPSRPRRSSSRCRPRRPRSRTRTSARPRSSATTATARSITFDCTNPEFAASRVLAAKGAIRVMRGDRLRARIAAELDAIAARYPGAGGDRSMRDVAQRLRRLLYIVPYVAKHPEGVPVEQLAKMLGADRDELLADLDLLSQVGPPDGDPGEYLLVSVDEGRVFVDLAHRLTRPLRLTPAEGCSLLLGIRALRESGIAPFDAGDAVGREEAARRARPRRRARRRASRPRRSSPSPTPRSRPTCARSSRRRASASASRSTTPPRRATRPSAGSAGRRPHAAEIQQLHLGRRVADLCRRSIAPLLDMDSLWPPLEEATAIFQPPRAYVGQSLADISL